MSENSSKLYSSFAKAQLYNQDVPSLTLKEIPKIESIGKPDYLNQLRDADEDETLDFLEDDELTQQQYNQLLLSRRHLLKLRNCFRSLCEQKQESIGANDLQDPLIGLGIAESPEEIQDMIRMVDKDGSGKIEFDEFLDIIKSTDGGDKSSKMYNFFKDMVSGNLKGSDNLPFSLLVCKMRRQKLFDALTSHTDQKKEEGEKLLKAVDKMLSKKKIEKTKTKKKIIQKTTTVPPHKLNFQP